MNQAENYPQNIFEMWKKWVIRLFRHKTADTDTLPGDRPVLSTEQEGSMADTEPRGSHSRLQHDASHTQSRYPAAVPVQPTMNSYATQFQGAHNFTISGNPTFTNIGVNNGVNNVNNVNNYGGVHVDNRGHRSYNIKVGTQYGNTNIGDNQHNDGGTYNFKDNH